jgi:hypothetical protein
MENKALPFREETFCLMGDTVLVELGKRSIGSGVHAGHPFYLVCA